MKLIKQTKLLYQQGSSDKVYEVDLYEIAPGSYVVNFRYAKRGGNLKEGTKTTQAVTLVKAQQIFDKLVAEKVKKGYQDIGAAPAPAKRIKPTIDKEARKLSILQHLVNKTPSTRLSREVEIWKLERAIWRAGELKIAEATSLLVKLIGTGEALRDYSIAWALGWCGGEGAIPALIKLYQSSQTPEFVSRIPFEALLKLSDEETKVALQEEMIEFLPPQLQNLARNGSAESFKTELLTYLENGNYKKIAALDKIYQINNQYVRPALI
ncbi:hypothetical protein RintRC_1123 [Richelia intracellularis]|nr:hypothetical protein RintRC_1123 [Richelia intracellularis]